MLPAMERMELKMLWQTRYAATQVTVPLVPAVQSQVYRIKWATNLMVTEVATSVNILMKTLTFFTSLYSYMRTQTGRTWECLLTVRNEHGDPRQGPCSCSIHVKTTTYEHNLYTGWTTAYCTLQHTRGDEIHLPHILMDAAQAGNNLLSLVWSRWSIRPVSTA